MNKILGEYIDEFVMIYIDDILIYSNNSFEKHLEYLRKVFRKLRKASMKLKLTKCKFCLPEIKYLGHIVRRNGLKPDPGRIEKIKNIKRSTTVKELRSVLGLFNYYRKFVKKFSEKAKPMNKFLRKGIKFEWKEEQEKAFEVLKEKLTEAPILQYPDFEKQFIIFTDASNKGLGAVLSQLDNKEKKRVIIYNSRS